MAAGTATLRELSPVDFRQDDDGHRYYTVGYQVITTDDDDGPGIVYNAAGLPSLGASYTTVGLNDVDDWAYHNKRPSIKCVSPRATGGGALWHIDCEFTTKPGKRCRDSQVENPLLEPYRLSGGFNKFTREAHRDNANNALTNSSHERIRGKTVEVDDNRPTLKLGVNWSAFNIALAADYIDAVNDSPFWGLPARTIKCSDMTWERVLYGTCNFYFRVDFVFEAKFDTWDVKPLDEGTKVLKPGGNVNVPTDFEQYKDPLGENGWTLLDGNGSALANAANPVYRQFRVYREIDFYNTGWPPGLFS